MTPIFNKGKVMNFGKIQESHHFIFGVEYTFFYLEDLHSWLNFKFIKSLEEKLKQNQSKQDLFEILIDSYPVLLKIDYQSHKIYMGHQRLMFEKILIKALEKDSLTKEAHQLESFIGFFTLSKIAQKTSDVELIEEMYHLAPFFKKAQDYKEIDSYAEILTKDFYQKVSLYKPNLRDKIMDSTLNLITQYPHLRNYLLKFVATLPSLHFKGADIEIKRLLLESLSNILVSDREVSKKNKLVLSLRSLIQFVYFALTFIPAFLLAVVIKASVRFMAERFIAGSSLNDAKKNLDLLRQSNRCATLDPLGELVVSKKEADEYTQTVLNYIESFASQIKPGTQNSAGIYEAHVSIKMTALCHHFVAHDKKFSFNEIYPRLKKILLLAKKHHVYINIDAEHYNVRDAVLDIYLRTLETIYPKTDQVGRLQTGIVVQAYLRDSYEHLNKILTWCKNQNLLMPIRLVKGAYWDAETIEAKAHSYLAPQFLNKIETDLHFKHLVDRILAHSKHLQLVLASHNVYDHAWAISLQKYNYPNSLVIEHQFLHKTFEPLSLAMAKQNYCVRDYVPIGDLLVGMAYLVRRIMENSSQVGILQQMRSDINIDEIMKQTLRLSSSVQGDSWQWDDLLGDSNESLFYNIAPVRLYMEKEFIDFSHSFEKYNLLETKYSFRDYSPSELVQAVQELKLESDWQNSFSFRIQTCQKAAHLLWQKRNELAVLIMKESHKTAYEALGDVDEAIDFINYYCIEAQYYSPQTFTKSLVIAPWNFPVAILCGMSVASLIMGHATIIKPAEQTPYCGEFLFNIFKEAGVPENVILLVQGDGEKVCKDILDQEDVGIVVFTGSRSVGTYLYNTFTLSHPNRFKKVIAEMGGKNPIIIARNADLDEALKYSLISSFSHSGQKCSACSRILVDQMISKSFIKRFQQASIDLIVDSQIHFATQVNPLIAASEKKRVLALTNQLKNEIEKYKGKILVDRINECDDPLIVGPLVFVISSQAYIASEIFQQEYFAPIVQIIETQGLDEALTIANATPYALTAGLLTQSTSDIKYFLERILAGNIYINRPITGARVGVEPFGGFKMSGTGPKAGGENYLESFLVGNERSQKTESLKTVYIPGQNNYLDQSIQVNCALVYLSTPKHIDKIKNIFSQYSVKYLFFVKDYSGEDKSILNITQESIYEIILRENIDLVISEPLLFQEVLKNKNLSTSNYLIKLETIDRFIQRPSDYLFYSRLIAENTMRHGAPLEIEKDIQ